MPSCEAAQHRNVKRLGRLHSLWARLLSTCAPNSCVKRCGNLQLYLYHCTISNQAYSMFDQT